MGELSGEEAAKWTGKPERPNERVASESIENDENATATLFRHSDFVINSSLDIRHSSFFG